MQGQRSPTDTWGRGDQSSRNSIEDTVETLSRPPSRYRRTYNSDSESDESDDIHLENNWKRFSSEEDNMNVKNNSSTIKSVDSAFHQRQNSLNEEILKESTMKNLEEGEKHKVNYSMSVDQNTESVAIIEPINNSCVPYNSSLKRKICHSSTSQTRCSSLNGEIKKKCNNSSLIDREVKSTPNNVPFVRKHINLNVSMKKMDLIEYKRNYCDDSKRPQFGENEIINILQRMFLYSKLPPCSKPPVKNAAQRSCELYKRKMHEFIPEFSELFDNRPSFNFSNVYRTYSLDFDDENFKYVANKFHETYGSNNIIAIDRVYNPYTHVRFQNRLVELEVINSDYKILHLFHGTSIDRLGSILRHNFNWKLFGLNVGNKFGRGVSFAAKASYSVHYTEKRNDCNVMLLSRVIVKHCHEGNKETILPNHGHDTTKNHNGQVWVKYHEDEFYIDYVIYFKHFSDDSDYLSRTQSRSQMSRSPFTQSMVGLMRSPYSDFNNPIQYNRMHL